MNVKEKTVLNDDTKRECQEMAKKLLVNVAKFLVYLDADDVTKASEFIGDAVGNSFELRDIYLDGALRASFTT